MAVADPVPVGDCEALCEGVAVGLSEMLPVLEADAPALSEPLGDSVVVLLPLSVEVGVTAAVPVEVPVGEMVAVGEAVPLGVPLEDSEVEDVLEGDTPRVRLPVGDWDTVVLALTVLLAVAREVPVGVQVGEPVDVLLGV